MGAKTMNVALILAGGVGSRMGNADRPKQYLLIHEKPVISYSLAVLQRHPMVDAIVVTAADAWRGYIDDWCKKERVDKLLGYAEPGETRQFSILNGLKRIAELAPDAAGVIVHDAARPVLSAEIVTACLKGLEEADGVLPILPMKDTCYRSKDGKYITGFIPRSQLFAGQAPEAFRFRPYLQAHESLDEDALRQISGSSELAYKCGLDVLLTAGSERNIKITTQEDLLLAAQYLDGEAT